MDVYTLNDVFEAPCHLGIIISNEVKVHESKAKGGKEEVRKTNVMYNVKAVTLH